MEEHSIDRMFVRLLGQIGLEFRRVGHEFYANSERARSSADVTDTLSGIGTGADKILIEDGEEIILLIRPRDEAKSSKGYRFHTRDCLVIHGMRTKGLAANYETLTRSGSDIRDTIDRFGQAYELCKHCARIESKAKSDQRQK